MSKNKNNLDQIAALIRKYILTSTSSAASGHPTTSLSATDLMTVLFFAGFFRYDIKNPKYINNDRLIFSKGHASPLLYALWSVAGAIAPEKLLTLRKFGSLLEGHPTPKLPIIEAATGSLGHGLSVGVGYAIAAKYLDKLPYHTYVLIGDGEMAEGSIWEAAALASYYKLNNLTAIIDINRLGQAGQTMYGWDLQIYEKRLKAFGFETYVIDGHNNDQISNSYEKVLSSESKPTAIIAKTIKGKGVPFFENKLGWHGNPLPADQLEKALQQINPPQKHLTVPLAKPKKIAVAKKATKSSPAKIAYEKGKMLATRKAYGNALSRIGADHDIVVLDAETKNSTYSIKFENAYPKRFFEMYIAEQNMTGVALGLSLRGKKPFISTFAAFWSRAYDQIRMSQYSDGNIVFAGSHAGVAIGPDGPSQMGLEDMAMFSALSKSTIFYPCDAVSTEHLVDLASTNKGITYLRTTRNDTPVIYSNSEKFKIGGSKVLRQSKNDKVAIFAAGITVHEALDAYENLKKQNISVSVVDCYSIRPIDKKTIIEKMQKTNAIIIVEDHYSSGGLGTAIMQAVADQHTKKPLYHMCVEKKPTSGTPSDLLQFEEINSTAIVKKVKKILKNG